MKQIKNSVLFISMISAWVFFGCKKNEDAPPPLPPPPIPWFTSTCPQCAGYGSPLLNYLESTTTSQMAFLRANIVGNYTAMNPSAGYPATGSTIFGYSGPVSFTGALSIIQPISEFCFAPPGDYTLQTVQMGQISEGRLGGIIVRAFNPMGGVITIQVQQGVIYTGNMADGMKTMQSHRLDLNLGVSYNGRNCGGVTMI